MKRFLTITLFLVPLLITTTISAETRLSKPSVRLIRTTGNYVYYSWKVRVHTSEKSKCAITISNRDKEGFEIHSDIEFVTLKGRSKILTAQGMCERNIWHQIDDYIAKLECF